jgi:hypothetical protein
MKSGVCIDFMIASRVAGERSLTTSMRLVFMRETICLEWAVLSVVEAMMFWTGLLTWKVLVRFWKVYEGQDWDMAVSHL